MRETNLMYLKIFYYRLIYFEICNKSESFIMIYYILLI